MDVFQRIISIIIPVVLIIVVGFIYARLRGPAVKTYLVSANRLCVELLSPLLLFSALAAKEFDLVANLPLLLAGALISLGSGLIAWPIARLLHYDVRTFIPPMMYNNCGNMGLPLAVLAFGPTGLSEAVAMFVAGSMVYFTVGIRIMESRRAGAPKAHLKMFATPMMGAMLAGMSFAALHLTLPAGLLQALRMLGEASIPLMLVALGVRMTDVNLHSWRIGLIGAIVCPLTGLAVAQGLDFLLPLTAVQRGQMFLFAALPPAVFCYMVAENYRQEPERVAAIVLLGNFAALAFVPLGLWLGMMP
jgi:predicted permease